MLGEQTRNTIRGFQRNEITEYHIYRRLADSIKDAHNREVLKSISDDELRHYGIWKKYTGADVKPNRFQILKYYLISRILGLTFGVKLMEKGEEQAQAVYDKISAEVPEAKTIKTDEDKHEHELISMLDEEKLEYVGSMVLGLNDALVELTGALAGFTFALQNPKLVAVTGLITGIAASFSMAASEYLSTKSEGGPKNPLKASVYTGTAYVMTVIALILPFLLLNNVYVSLGLTLLIAIAVIFFFTFYISVAKDIPFKSRFLEMASISLGVATVTFTIGYLIREFWGIEI
ncbi:MAG: VIT1/CCC1 transporter family protein [Candidatus Altiarchaeota archaeon]